MKLTDAEILEAFQLLPPVTIKAHPFLLMTYLLALPEIIAEDDAPEWVKQAGRDLMAEISSKLPIMTAMWEG